jgi:hypothetical protein
LAAIDHDSAGQPQSTDPVELSRQFEELKGVPDTLTRERDWARSRAITHGRHDRTLGTEPRTRIWVWGRTRLLASVQVADTQPSSGFLNSPKRDFQGNSPDTVPDTGHAILF